MRRTGLAVFILLLQAVFGSSAYADTPLSTSLTYTPVWNASGVDITFTYKALAEGYPCPDMAPIGNPVRFRMDGTVFSDGTLLDDNCTATAKISLPQSSACDAHTFTAALHDAGDDTAASETGQATAQWTANSPAMGPYGCLKTTATTPHLPSPAATSTNVAPAPASTSPTQQAPAPVRVTAPQSSPAPKASPSSSASAPATVQATLSSSIPATTPIPSATTSATPSESKTPIAAALDSRHTAHEHGGVGMWILAGGTLIALLAASVALFRWRFSRP